MSIENKQMIPRHIRRRIALRKFVAIPLTILSATIGSVLAAHYAAVELLDSEGSYTLAVFIGAALGTILAYGFKGLLKLRGEFKMDYVIASLLTVTLMVSALSFLLHVFIVAAAYL